MKYVVSHGWHGCEGLSEGCMGLGMFVMGRLGETVCHGGLSAMAIQVWQSNVWVKYIVMSGMVVEVCPRIAWVVACFAMVA